MSKKLYILEMSPGQTHPVSFSEAETVPHQGSASLYLKENSANFTHKGQL